LILKPVGKGKLSKRDGDKMGFPVFPLKWNDPETGETFHGYREDGYFPEAFVNLLALLGWNPGTEQEFFTLEELTGLFSLERVVKSGSRFDPEKAKWFNHQYLQKRSNKQLAFEFREFLRAKGIFVDIVELETLIGLVKERVSFVKDIWDQTDFFFKAPETYDPEVIKKRWREDSASLLTELRTVLTNINDFSPGSTEPVVKEWIEKNGYNMGAVMNAFRLVIVGASRGPHMFDIIEWIGKEETIRRIDKGLSLIGK
jgi:glutamyl-tRNA synthetase